MPDGMGFTLQLPPVANPELAMVAGMSAPLPADAASVAPLDANIPDTSLSLSVALQQPSHWQYDFDPVSGISRASYVGEVDTGGGDDEELVTFNGSVKIIGADPNPTLQLYSKADTIAWVSLLFYTLWTSNPGQAAQIGILRNAVQIWTWFFAESSSAADFRLIRHDMTTGANIDFPLIIPHASGNLQIGFPTPPADAGFKLDVNGTARISELQVYGNAFVAGGLGVWNATPPATQPTLTGAWAGNTAGKALSTLLASFGLFVDGTTA